MPAAKSLPSSFQLCSITPPATVSASTRWAALVDQITTFASPSSGDADVVAHFPAACGFIASGAVDPHSSCFDVEEPSGSTDTDEINVGAELHKAVPAPPCSPRRWRNRTTTRSRRAKDHAAACALANFDLGRSWHAVAALPAEARALSAILFRTARRATCSICFFRRPSDSFKKPCGPPGKPSL